MNHGYKYRMNCPEHDPLSPGSMANPRIPRKLVGRKVARSAQLHEGPDLAGRRLPDLATQSAPALTVLPGFRTLVQDPFLPPSHSQSALDPEATTTPVTPTSSVGPFPQADYATSSPIRFDFAEEENYWSVRYADRKARQWARWAERVIPSLLHPYLDLLAERAQGKSSAPPHCKCNSPGRTLEVVAVYWESKSCSAVTHS